MQATQDEALQSSESTPLPPECSVKLDEIYCQGFVKDPAALFVSSAQWQKRTWITLGLVTATALVLYQYDGHIQDWSQDHRSPTSDQITKVVKPLGNGAATIPLMAAAYLIGKANGSDKLQEAALLSFESFILTGVSVNALKFATHRDRPSESLDPRLWHGPSFQNHHLSFPSGDASTAFAVATMFATEYRGKGWVPPLAYGLATLTTLGRINDNAHWASDVFVGSSIGYFMSKSIYRLHHSSSAKSWTVVPIMERHKRGLLMACRF